MHAEATEVEPPSSCSINASNREPKSPSLLLPPRRQQQGIDPSLPPAAPSTPSTGNLNLPPVSPVRRTQHSRSSSSLPPPLCVQDPNRPPLPLLLCKPSSLPPFIMLNLSTRKQRLHQAFYNKVFTTKSKTLKLPSTYIGCIYYTKGKLTPMHDDNDNKYHH